MSVPVRFVHVLAMAAIVGGAGLAWALVEGSQDGDGEPTTRSLLPVAWGYERLFWVAAGAAVMTGVGNLGTMAPAVPGPGTGWGLAFGVKLGGVVVLLAGSALRTTVVWLARRNPRPERDRRLLRASYAGTTLLALGIVGLAEVIAHG